MCLCSDLFCGIGGRLSRYCLYSRPGVFLRVLGVGRSVTICLQGCVSVLILAMNWVFSVLMLSFIGSI